jgi:hypothetical protein
MATSKLDSKFGNILLLSTNNYPLCSVMGRCDDNEEEDEYGNTTKIVHVALVTFETILKNIVCFPNITDIDDDDYYVRKYSLPDDKEITLTVDMRVDDIITSTLSGDVPDGINLVKTVNMVNADRIDIKYT